MYILQLFGKIVDYEYLTLAGTMGPVVFSLFLAAIVCAKPGIIICSLQNIGFIVIKQRK